LIRASVFARLEVTLVKVPDDGGRCGAEDGRATQLFEPVTAEPNMLEREGAVSPVVREDMAP